MGWAFRRSGQAGEGSTLQLRFGGKTAPLADSGPPVDGLVAVRKCVENAVHSYGQSVVPLGDSALVELPPLPEHAAAAAAAAAAAGAGHGDGGIQIILNTNRTQVLPAAT